MYSMAARTVAMEIHARSSQTVHEGFIDWTFLEAKSTEDRAEPKVTEEKFRDGVRVRARLAQLLHVLSLAV